MASKAIYARVETEVFNKLKAYSDTSGNSTSTSVEELIKKGLAESSAEELLKARDQELITLREKHQELEKKQAELTGALEASKAKESIALAAQSHSAALQQERDSQKQLSEQLRNYLLTPVALCHYCHTQLRLFDIGQHKCPFCGRWGSIDWLPEYTAPPTAWELVRDGAAVVGATTIVVALLNALNSGQQRA